MGSHAKPRTTGRRAVLSALALGTTLTGVGLTFAALDPATAVMNASGPDEGGAIQLSGLSTPVSLDLSPAADSVADLSAAPLQPLRPITGSATGGSSDGSPSGTGKRALADSVGSVAKNATSTTTTSTGDEKAIKPIVASTPGTSSGTSGSSTTSSTGTSSTGTSSSSGSSGSGSTGTGTSTQPRSAAPPSADSALASVVQSTVAQVLPTVAGVVSKVPVVSTVVQDTGLLGTDSGTGSSTASGTDPVTGVVGSLPLVGALLGGSGDGQSTVTVPGVSTIAGLL